VPESNQPDDAALALQSLINLMSASRRTTLHSALLVLAYAGAAQKADARYSAILDVAFEESPNRRDGADIVDKAAVVVADAILRVGYFRPDAN
jgi:hypothetical protein